MPTSDIIRRKQQDRSMQVRTHAADKEETKGKLQDLSTHRTGPEVSHNGRWTLDKGKRITMMLCPKKHTIFSQGEKADAVFYIQAGKVKLTVVSPQGKEAIVAILDCGSFVGEACLAGHTVQLATATALEDSSLVRIDKDAMIRLLHEDSALAELFLSYLLTHSMRVREDLADHLLNNSEKRLARVLLLMAHSVKEGKPEAVIPKVSQETLAELVGTTRSRVNFFMNKFRKLGFVDYGSKLHVRSSLLKVILQG